VAAPWFVVGFLTEVYGIRIYRQQAGSAQFSLSGVNCGATLCADNVNPNVLDLFIANMLLNILRSHCSSQLIYKSLNFSSF
jgi:hypothetical protein